MCIGAGAIYSGGARAPSLLGVGGARGHRAGATELMFLRQNIHSVLHITTEQLQGRFYSTFTLGVGQWEGPGISEEGLVTGKFCQSYGQMCSF